MTVDALLPDTLTVRLLRAADGAPLAGVACRLAALDDDGAVAAEPARAGASDDAGLLAWNWEPHRAGYELYVAETDATMPWRQRLAAPGLVEVRVPGWAWSIDGEAVTREGAPLPGVTVRLWWASFRSILDWGAPDLALQADVAGRFRVEHPAAGGDATFVLCATAPGRMSAHAQAGLMSPQGGPLTARLVMVPASEVAVRVVTASGAPVEAATLRASTRGEFHAGITLQQVGGPPADWRASLSRCHDVPLPAFTQRTGPDGRTRWSFTHEGWSLSVAHSPGHPPWRDGIHGAGGDVEVVLHDGVALEGLVLDARGEPPDARFLFNDLDPGVWRLSVRDARSFEAGPWAGPVAAYDAGRHEVPLHVETGASAPPVR
jgi:hypothetical protein